MSRARTQWCKHYHGMHEKTHCEAGVAFESVLPHKVGLAGHRIPCFLINSDEGKPPVPCDRCEYPTAEEVEEQNRKDEKRMLDIGKARQAIVDHLGGPWKRGMPGASGVIDCPACLGVLTLGFSRSSYNGHIHASCNTPGCVRWME